MHFPIAYFTEIMNVTSGAYRYEIGTIVIVVPTSAVGGNSIFALKFIFHCHYAFLTVLTILLAETWHAASLQFGDQKYNGSGEALLFTWGCVTRGIVMVWRLQGLLLVSLRSDAELLGETPVERPQGKTRPFRHGIHCPIGILTQKRQGTGKTKAMQVIGQSHARVQRENLAHLAEGNAHLPRERLLVEVLAQEKLPLLYLISQAVKQFPVAFRLVARLGSNCFPPPYIQGLPHPPRAFQTGVPGGLAGR